MYSPFGSPAPQPYQTGFAPQPSYSAGYAQPGYAPQPAYQPSYATQQPASPLVTKLGSLLAGNIAGAIQGALTGNQGAQYANHNQAYGSLPNYGQQQQPFFRSN